MSKWPVPKQYTETKDAVWTRFTAVKGEQAEGDTDPPGSDQAVDYAYKALDRQINKTRGLLSYNGLLFAGIRLGDDTETRAAVAVVAVSALISSAFLLWPLIMDWGKVDDYTSARSDFDSTVRDTAARTEWAIGSLLVTLFATVVAVGVLVAPWFR